MERTGTPSGSRSNPGSSGAQPLDIVLDGQYAYAAHDTGLEILSLPNPGAPEPQGHLYLPSEPLDLCVNGTIVYLACGESGVQIADVTDPAAPILVSTRSGFAGRAVAVQGNTLLVGEGSEEQGTTGSLRLYDLTDPAAPTLLGSLPLDNGANAVKVQNTTAYVALGSSLGNQNYGMIVVDISDPSLPVTAGSFYTTEKVNDLHLRNNTVFLAAGVGSFGMIYAVDVTVPDTPMEQDRLPILLDTALDLSMEGDLLLAAAGEYGLVLVDAADPSNLALLSVLPADPAVSGVASLAGTTVIAERSYYISVGAVSRVSLTPPTDPRLVASTTYSAAMDVAAGSGNLAYLLNTEGLVVYDAADGANAQRLGSFKPPTAAFYSLDVDGTTAVIADEHSMRIIDASDPADLQEFSVVFLPDYAIRPVIDGTILYAVDSHGYTAFDITQPDNPVELGGYYTDLLASDMALAGTMAYLSAGTDLIFLDVTDPGAPAEAGTYYGSEFLEGVEVRNGVAYLAGLNSALTSLDVSDPLLPLLLDQVPGGPGFGISLSGTVALVSSARDGVRAFDTTDPSNLAEIAFYDTSGIAISTASDGPTLYAATLDAQFWILDCPDCASCAVPPEKRAGVRLVRQDPSVLFYWDPTADPKDTRVYRVADKALLGQTNGSLPEATLVIEGGASPLTAVDEVNQGTSIEYYQLVGVCPDGVTEGPN